VVEAPVLNYHDVTSKKIEDEFKDKYYFLMEIYFNLTDGRQGVYSLIND